MIPRWLWETMVETRSKHRMEKDEHGDPIIREDPDSERNYNSPLGCDERNDNVRKIVESAKKELKNYNSEK